MATSHDIGWASRVSGSLLLAACGDALGARFEGAGRVDLAELDRWLEAPGTLLRWTDDTAMALVLAGHLSRRGGTVDEDELAAEFVAAWSREPTRGYGPGTTAVLAAIRDGMRWSHAAARVFAGSGSLGNGAAMRVAPIGLLPGLGLTAIAGRARRSAAVTHANPHGQDGAAVQAVAVALAARTTRAAPVRQAAFVGQVATHVQTPEFRAALTHVAALVRRETTPSEVAAILGNDVRAVNSVPPAIAAFLLNPDDPGQAIRFAISIGGDTDTIAAMTGALCGARCGAESLPARWTRHLEAGTRIAALAGELADLPAVPAGADLRAR